MKNEFCQIVKLSQYDANELHNLEASAFDDAWSVEQFEKALMSKNYLCYGVKLKDSTILVAYIMLSIIPSIEQMRGGECEIINIATKEEYRKQGLANILLEHICLLATKEGIDAIFLDVRESNHAAISLYLKHNFINVGKRKNYYSTIDGFENAILMQFNAKNI